MASLTFDSMLCTKWHRPCSQAGRWLGRHPRECSFTGCLFSDDQARPGAGVHREAGETPEGPVQLELPATEGRRVESWHPEREPRARPDGVPASVGEILVVVFVRGRIRDGATLERRNA